MGHKKNSRKVSFKRFRRYWEDNPDKLLNENGYYSNGRRIVSAVWGLIGTQVKVNHDLNKEKDRKLLESALRLLKKKMDAGRIFASIHNNFMPPSERKKQKSRRARRSEKNNN